MLTRSDRRFGFTLIELLVVIAIIMVLAALLLPAMGRVRQRSKILKARQEIAQLETVLIGYLNEYGRPFGNVGAYPNWPGAADADTVEDIINGIQMEEPLMRMLAGENVDGANPLQMPFLSVMPDSINADGQYVDPWENPYKFMLDYNGDGMVTVNFTDFSGKTNLVGRAVAVWSRGPDGSDKESDSGWEDDIRNW